MVTIAIMAQALVVEQSRIVPVAVADAFSGTAPIPLNELFCRWYGPIPPIKAVRNQTGIWDAVGQTRTILLTGGGSMAETLTSYDEPHSFGYTLSDINGPLAPLVGGVQGMWLFQDVSGGQNPRTKITWRWTLHPRSSLTAPLLPVFGKLWKGYAGRSLEHLSDLLVG
ncbi:Polyketide cyclase / dehydrase and lipid transport [Mycobacterium sp. 283mftsu]|jgi:hypothetical protein|nr:Polyketide cyclase / dehydrase and lipid transport [Mycobacterium sp. 283mftsu]